MSYRWVEGTENGGGRKDDLCVCGRGVAMWRFSSFEQAEDCGGTF